MHSKFWQETRKERGHLGYLGVDGRIILKLILKNGLGWCVDWLRMGICEGLS
jgi:hypothetical protein